MAPTAPVPAPVQEGAAGAGAADEEMQDSTGGAVVAQSSSGDASAGAQLQQELATKIAAVQQAGAQNKAAVLDFLTSTVADVNISADPATRTKAVN